MIAIKVVKLNKFIIRVENNNIILNSFKKVII